MQNHDDLLIFEKYQQVNEVFGYGWSPLQRGLAALGSKQARGRVSVEKQANQLVASLKQDAAQSGFEHYEDVLNDKKWFSGWLNNYLGADLTNDAKVQKAIKSKSAPFDIIKLAINQANRAQYIPPQQQGATQQPQQAATPQQQGATQQPQQAATQQPQQAATQQAATQQAATQQPQVQGTKSTAATKIIKAIKSLTPGEVAYIKQALGGP